VFKVVLVVSLWCRAVGRFKRFVVFSVFSEAVKLEKAVLKLLHSQINLGTISTEKFVFFPETWLE
jgi:hypothetical protein